MKQQQQHRLIAIILAIATILAALVGRPPHAPFPKQALLLPDRRELLGTGSFSDPKTTTPRLPAPGPGVVLTAHDPPPEEFSVCGRTVRSNPSYGNTTNAAVTNCPPFDPRTPTLVLRRKHGFGQTGNNLRSLFRAMQYVRDEGIQLGLVQGSWATAAVLPFFMAGGDGDDWISRMEERLCVKIIPRDADLQGWEVKSENRKTAHQMFYYRGNSPREEYVARRLHVIRTLFQYYNSGVGRDDRGKAVKDMCSAIDSLFADVGREGAVGAGEREDRRSAASYSVLHLRYLKATKAAKRTGCDELAARNMEPEYVKSILGPQGMLAQPIVIISDGTKGAKLVLARLQSDPEIGPLVRIVPKQAMWLGGDMTLAVMATVFIGNPASTLSAFIARSRVALGFEHSYMYLARDEKGWTTVCGDSCLF